MGSFFFLNWSVSFINTYDCKWFSGFNSQKYIARGCIKHTVPLATLKRPEHTWTSSVSPQTIVVSLCRAMLVLEINPKLTDESCNPWLHIQLTVAHCYVIGINWYLVEYTMLSLWYWLLLQSSCFMELWVSFLWKLSNTYISRICHLLSHTHISLTCHLSTFKRFSFTNKVFTPTLHS